LKNRFCIMAKSKNPSKTPFAIPKTTAQAAITPKVESHAVRETVESIVIAFVLAFLFRTFEAEAFVIPTGSMAPTLMGRHKDVDCPKCGYRYQVTASEEEPSEDREQLPSQIIAGMCPLCHYVMPMLPNLPPGVPEREQTNIAKQPSYNGDRILVNKYLYTFANPERWDVVVFKYPGDAKVNYIKRLVGLPEETLRIYQGDIFIGPEGATKDEEFTIERKPPDKVLAMRQLVHDTEHDPAELDVAGWPLRWHAPPGDANGWKLDKTIEGVNVRQRYSVDATGDTTSWLRYEHLVPSYADWQLVTGAKVGQPAVFANFDRSSRRRLVTDSNPYNARVDREKMPFSDSLQVSPERVGIHWVGDLMLEAEVQVESAAGELLLDLVEGGRHFGCTFDLKSGEVKLSAANAAEFAPKAQTSIVAPGKYHVAFANVDDQLLLWVDGRLVPFEGGTAYDATKVFGDRRSIRPATSATDLGDLAPAGIGARGATLVVSRMQVWRDIYYIADRWDRMGYRIPVTDFGKEFDFELLNLATNPALWNRFGERQTADFPIGEGQLFVMGDNSAESSDARLWFGGNNRGAKPGGAYLDKRLLIGKALSVYWPHSWNRIPGTPIPFPLFPNVTDMRLVR
jgi:signal peptidase I